ncbi:alpha/beta hydrolase [Bombilactobacillus thymidiniphilus]|uniref:Alpha/beta fold hydrolase n=1 Tax=Bombilactobacillus thymidiniphilus TaxID=2923363 RepID=A0ABY4PDQ8_9LACO|nr:alpha/beta fold hydrolase [Bombilactobacillus thymidiniphilus]UQS83412.1 alpha/beta fold hydrolase [Bombilactobacillus thymidiniphilus]
MNIVAPQTLFMKAKPSERNILFLHSYTGSPNDFRIIGHSLVQNNMSVYLPLFTGHGTSNPIDILQKGSVDAWWKDTCRAIEHLTTKHLIVIGLSLGSIFALRALVEYPQIEAGVVLGCPVEATDFTAVNAGFYQYVQKIDTLQQVDVATKAQHMRIAQQKLPKALHDIQKQAVQVKQQLKAIKQPLFIGHGQEDQIIDPKVALNLVDNFPDQQVNLHIYPKAGHVITVNQARPALTHDLIKFLTVN